MKKRPVLKEKHYAHFDHKVLANQMEHYVKSPEKVAQHGFMPLIHFQRKDIKYSKIEGRKPKLRDLYYVSHKDAFVCQWYAHILNERYNQRVKRDGTNNSVIAYRNNKHGKFNAHFAKEVIDFIKDKGACHIIVGDFTGFFDNLDHKYLKSMLCNLLNVDQLPNDQWNIFKNITRYAWFELTDLLKINGLKDYKEINRLESVLTVEQLHSHKREYLHKYVFNYGIPQGTPISAIYSNIYMIEFDKHINDFVTSNQGLYRRYSDDFIIVLPKEINIDAAWLKINEIRKKTPKVTLQPNKTKLFLYENSVIKNCNSKIFTELPNTKNELEYLGFSFDGKHVYVGNKTISKFYYRAYHRVDSLILRVNGIVDKKPDYYTLYQNYTHLGKKPQKRHRGNFLTYIDRCIEVFGTEEKIHLVKKRHWKQIHNRIKKATA